MSLKLTLELIGATKDRDTSKFEFTRQDYLLRQPDGTHTRATFDWDEQVLNDLAELSKPKPDFTVVRRFGRTLRKFLEDLRWKDEQLERAVQPGEPVHLTFRFEAGELCSLPWECLTLKESGLPLGKVQGCVIRYEWVGARPVPPRASPEPEGGRLLFAWSAAGGEVPAAAHAEALARACARGHYPFDARRDVLGNVSLERLKEALDASDEPIAALHLLCHGTRVSEITYGLRWDRVVDAETLASELAPHASRIRMLVLCACQSADPGRLDNDLGSIAVALHRAGFPAVVASRLPLSAQGSVQLTETLYGELLERPASLQQALGEARQRLVRSSEHLDWASLQLYARAEISTDYRPFILRPYRGLLAFQPEHSRFFFGREALQQELLERVQQAAAGQLPRFQVVAGASGSGKSSLVLAGLVPALPAEQWDILVMRPGEQRGRSPAAVLRRKLTGLWRPAQEPSEVATPADVLSEAEALRQTRPGRMLLLVVDQLEEVFTQVNAAAERQAFASALWELAQASALRVTVVSTLRVDYFERCGEIAVTPAGPRLDEVVYSEMHRLFVPQLGQQPLHAVIECPAHAVGLELDEGLDALLQRDVGQEPGALPLLEYALDLLWERREGQRLTLGAYETMAGVTGALTQTAQRLYDGLSAEEQRQARRLLVALVDFGTDTSPHTRRRVWLEQVLPSGEEARAAFETALEKLVAERLLVRGQDVAGSSPASGIWIEVAHEALIRKWEQLGAWVKQDREHASQLREIQAWADAWLAHRNDQDGGNSYLLAGNKLGYARQLQDRHEADLSRESHQLIERSIQAAEAAKALEQKRQSILKNFARQMAASNLGRDDPTTGVLVLRETEGLDELDANLSWKAAALELLQRPIASEILRHSGAVRAATFSSDGNWVVTASDDGMARVWSAQGRTQPIVLSGHSGPVRAAAFSPDGRRVVTASDDGTARVWSTWDPGQPLVLTGHSGSVRTAAFSPDGGRVVTASDDGTARVWSTQDPAPMPIVLTGHSGSIRTAAFSPDGGRVVTASDDRTARVWSAVKAAKPIVLKGHSDSVFTAGFSPDGRKIATASLDGTARVWSAEGRTKPIVLSGHSGPVRMAVFSPDGSRVVTASDDETACVWSTGGPNESSPGVPTRGASRPRRHRPPLLVLKSQSSRVLTAAFSPDGHQVVAGSADGTARVWNMDDPSETLVLKGHSSWVFTAAFSPDGSRVVTASFDGTARVWGTDSPVEPLVLKGHSKSVNAAAFSPDGRKLVTASYDGTARVWSIEGPAKPLILKGHAGLIVSAVFSPDGRRVATASDDGTTRIWNSDDPAEPLVLKGHSQSVRTVAFSPDGRRVVTASDDGSARVWRADALVEHLVLAGHSGVVIVAAFSPDGRRVVTASGDGTARVWSAEHPVEPLVLGGHSGSINTAAFSLDGRWVVTGSEDGTARMWSADCPAEPLVLGGQSGSVNTVAFSPDGQRVMTGSDDGTVRVWSAKCPVEPLVLKGHSNRILAAAFSPDGRQLVTASVDRTARVWTADRLTEPLVLRGHSAPVLAAVFSPDGRRIVTTSNDRTARIWRVSTALLMERMREATAACLTPSQREIYLGETDGGDSRGTADSGSR